MTITGDIPNRVDGWFVAPEIIAKLDVGILNGSYSPIQSGTILGQCTGGQLNTRKYLRRDFA